MTEPFQIGQEISVTGKWVPKTPGGLFRKSADSEEMLKEWEGIHSSAKADSGILSTEINHAVGADAVLFHHVFRNPDALVHYFKTTATKHMLALMHVAKPEQHLFRGKKYLQKSAKPSVPRSRRQNLVSFCLVLSLTSIARQIQKKPFK